MKTRDRILHSSLALFNHEGEPNTTTVDIANELDISPGNLYYHFKGKDVIIAELFDQYEHGITEILKAPIDRPLSVEDNWFYLYVVFEEMYKYRFLYRNLSDLLARYPELGRRFRRLVDLKHAAITAVWRTLSEAAVVSTSDEEAEALVDNMVLLLTYWLNYDHLLHQDRPPALIIHQGVYQLMSMIAPYLGEQQRDFYEQVRNIYRTLIAPAAAK
ncbi:MAG: TetR/AcrR family transcriptional regulator [Halieaceae bacterium]|nr:TetR/AcrR family transcriptional regulator [Halieaceae bacterium]